MAVIAVSSFCSYLFNLNTKYNVTIMGPIPSGLPGLEAPKIPLIRKVLPDAFAITMVTYAVALSVGKIYAKKYRYEIRPSQELIALGTADLLSSFVSCYPCSASLSRTPVQEKAGSRSQLASIVAAIIILMTLLFLGPYFYYLPKCILGSIILMALKTMIMQISDLFTIWQISHLEGIYYLITFSSVVLLDVDIGLIVGILLAILILLIRTTWPHVALLEHLPNTELYVESSRFRNSLSHDNIRIYRFSCALNFINGESFRDNLYKLCFNSSYYRLLELDSHNRKSVIGKVTAVIIDCSTISYIDIIGLETIVDVINSLKDFNIKCYLAACPATVLDMLERGNFSSKISTKNPIFPTIHDAVMAELTLNRV